MSDNKRELEDLTREVRELTRTVGNNLGLLIDMLREYLDMLEDEKRKKTGYTYRTPRSGGQAPFYRKDYYDPMDYGRAWHHENPYRPNFDTGSEETGDNG